MTKKDKTTEERQPKRLASDEEHKEFAQLMESLDMDSQLVVQVPLKKTKTEKKPH